MMPAIRCASRKETGCKAAPEVCKWDDKIKKCGDKGSQGSTPDKKQSPITADTAVPKKVICKLRKMKSCNEVPELCQWDKVGQKCNDKIVKNITKEIILKKINCKLRKLKACLERDDVCKWFPKSKRCTDRKEANSSSKKKTPSPPTRRSVSPPIKKRTPSPPKHSKAPLIAKRHSVSPPSANSKLGLPPDLDNRHCKYYSEDPKHVLSFSDKVDTKGCLYEKYDREVEKKVEVQNVHLGQRKLMLSEIQMLTQFYKEQQGNKQIKHPIVVYAGAAPGHHMKHLSMMFPQVYFKLYDGAKFNQQLQKHPRFQINEGENEGFVTTEKVRSIAQELQSVRNVHPLIFISDIRLGGKEFEKGVLRDLASQKEWVEIFKPKLALLKFRLPYTMKHGDTYGYFDGDLFYGIWPPPSSGETRLLVTDYRKTTQYDFKTYEETLFFHNKYRRAYCTTDAEPELKPYINGKGNTYCPCYDCVSELRILNEYRKYAGMKLDVVVDDFMVGMNYMGKKVFLQGANKHYKQPREYVPISGIIKRKMESCNV